MNSSNVLGAMGVIVGLLPYGSALRRLLVGGRTRRLLRLAGGDLDAVLSTNSEPDGPHTTAVGELRGIAVATRAVHDAYGRKRIAPHLSHEFRGYPDGDLLLLGGPSRNALSARFLADLNLRYPSARLDVDTATGTIGLAGRRFALDGDGGTPREDLGLVVLARWSGHGRRVLFCAGLSTYGTEGAARYLFQDVLPPCGHNAQIRRALSAPAAAVVVHVEVRHGRAWRPRIHSDAFWSAAYPS
ncbi:MAG: hypothetical protein ACJ73S_07415 [Mycobacteriales bacterium]